MAGKFIALAQAAEMLGVTPEKLDDMRKRAEIHALRDGTSWKFKKEELERVAEEWGIALAGQGGEDGLLDVAGLGPAGASELVLGLDSDESGDGATTIFKPDKEKDNRPITARKTDSQVSLVPEDSSSDVNLISGSSDILSGTDPALKGDSDDLDFDSGLGLGSGVSVEDPKKQVDDEDDLTLGDADEITLGEDKESALEGGSDVTRGAGDTGINLQPTDSGLNLEEVPLDLAGSSVSSLELPEDDEIIALEELDASPDDATQLRADEDFQLAPAAARAQDEEDDSGSQVIALEDSEAFDEAAPATPLAGLEEDDVGAMLPAAGGAEEINIEEEVKAVTTMREYVAAPEMAYSIWNVLGLLVIVLIMATTGMLMTDLIRNMWSFDGTFSASTPIMDSLVRLLNMEP